MRTTSSLESINSQLQRMLPENAHLYKFIECLRLHESIKSSDLYQISIGNITNQNMKKRRAEDRARDAKIKLLSGKLKKQEISVAGFLRSMSKNKTSKTTRTYEFFAHILACKFGLKLINLN